MHFPSVYDWLSVRPVQITRGTNMTLFLIACLLDHMASDIWCLWLKFITLQFLKCMTLVERSFSIKKKNCEIWTSCGMKGNLWCSFVRWYLCLCQWAGVMVAQWWAWRWEGPRLDPVWSLHALPVVLRLPSSLPEQEQAEADEQTMSIFFNVFNIQYKALRFLQNDKNNQTRHEGAICWQFALWCAANWNDL